MEVITIDFLLAKQIEAASHLAKQVVKPFLGTPLSEAVENLQQRTPGERNSCQRGSNCNFLNRGLRALLIQSKLGLKLIR